MSKVSLKQIAEHVGVSKTTASFVLNGMGKQKRISDAVIRKIMQAAKEMNYKPNRLARSLRTGSTYVLGVIVIDVANHFHSKLSRAIEDCAAKHGYRVMICSSDENDTLLNEWVDELVDNKVEGLIITPTVYARPKLMELQKIGYPFVLVDRKFSNIETDYVGIDNAKASFDATRMMIERGYDKIGIVAFEPHLDIIINRIEGYKQAVLQHGLGLNEDFIRTIGYSNIQEQVRIHVTQLVENGIRGLLFTSNRIGVTGLQCLTELSVRIPEDVAVFTYDDNEFFPLMKPTISAISQPIEEMGERAVELLISRLKNPEKEKENIMLEATVICRNSI
jgi:LacI family transcriptional regulator